VANRSSHEKIIALPIGLAGLSRL